MGCGPGVRTANVVGWYSGNRGGYFWTSLMVRISIALIEQAIFGLSAQDASAVQAQAPCEGSRQLYSVVQWICDCLD